ncbi:MAG: ribonuclease P protein component [Nitrospirae bacterium]|nr:ribonuclease P protein component [Nitrospirota bacterium]MBF0591972.1 ribonuclease P protein component [Nitrospirota bacterium]
MKKGYEFKKVFSIGRHLSSKSFKLCYVPHRKVGTQDWRIGLAVSKRIGNAVVRNRVKRRLREAFRRELGNYLSVVAVEHLRDMSSGYDVVFVARQGISNIAYIDLCREMGVFFGRIAGKQRTSNQK